MILLCDKCDHLHWVDETSNYVLKKCAMCGHRGLHEEWDRAGLRHPCTEE